MKRNIIGLIFIGLLFISCETDYADYYYEVTGTATNVDITISDLFGGNIQHDNVNIPWQSQVYRNDSPENRIFAYISAQNQGSTGNITVKIYRNGDVIKSSTSTGAYCIASTSYSNK